MIVAVIKVLLALLALWELVVAWFYFFGSTESPQGLAVDSSVVAVVLPLVIVVPILLVLWGWHFARRLGR